VLTADRRAAWPQATGPSPHTDPGSTNATRLNGCRISEAEARPGDVRRLGEIDLLL
jgi:pSer/pThr/pTyr-binding forkhead associated (FHA) protein